MNEFKDISKKPLQVLQNLNDKKKYQFHNPHNALFCYEWYFLYTKTPLIVLYSMYLPFMIDT